MESLLDNLQKIEDLRVISRTSAEKYRHNPNSSLVINILFDFYTGFVPDAEKYLEFQKILPRIELKFWKYHKEVKDSLKEKKLL